MPCLYLNPGFNFQHHIWFPQASFGVISQHRVKNPFRSDHQNSNQKWTMCTRAFIFKTHLNVDFFFFCIQPKTLSMLQNPSEITLSMELYLLVPNLGTHDTMSWFQWLLPICIGQELTSVSLSSALCCPLLTETVLFKSLRKRLVGYMVGWENFTFTSLRRVKWRGTYTEKIEEK